MGSEGDILSLSSTPSYPSRLPPFISPISILLLHLTTCSSFLYLHLSTIYYSIIPSLLPFLLYASLPTTPLPLSLSVSPLSFSLSLVLSSLSISSPFPHLPLHPSSLLSLTTLSSITYLNISIICLSPPISPSNS